MTGIAKGVGKAIAVTLVLALLAWTCVFLYWQIQIIRALRIWEKDATPWRSVLYWRQSGAPPEASRILDRAGCRALPYFVGSLDGPGTAAFKEGLVGRFIQCLAGPIRDKETVRILDERYEEWGMELRTTPAQREEKISKVKAWWGAHRSQHHQWWRVWSSNCR